jgi:hypothetical protein
MPPSPLHLVHDADAARVLLLQPPFCRSHAADAGRDVLRDELVARRRTWQIRLESVDFEVNIIATSVDATQMTKALQR